MIRLPLSLAARHAAGFREVLQQELQSLAEELPLQQGLSQGSVALTDDVQVMILAVEEGGDGLVVRFGVFYSAVIAGCSCADDPTPLDVVSEYCEMRALIDVDSGQAVVSLSGAG